MLYESVCSENIRLEQEIKSIESTLNSLPKGKLICAKCGKYTKWYQSDGHHSTYLPKAEKILAKQLAYKKYLSLKLEELKQEKSAISLYLRHHSTKERPSAQLLSPESRYSELLASYFTPQSHELANWIAETYEKNPLYPDFTIRHPITGNYYYWEHFGMMDVKEYIQNTFSKLNLYSANGILPSIHLITTYESKEHPLNYDTVENLIHFHFL